MEQETNGKIEDILRELGKKIDQLIEETKEASAGVRDEIEDKIEALKAKKADLENEFQHYKDQEKWNEAKEHFSSAVHEFRKGVEAMFNRK
ncbi:MAG: hypothetical protein OEY56_03185 [Cyclobacteriaceae bacterium]|nr:hypothetical protein [Cyclobacteriaceae bacterium]